jgi:glycerophosphoryl diester phosphodiesterase
MGLYYLKIFKLVFGLLSAVLIPLIILVLYPIIAGLFIPKKLKEENPENHSPFFAGGRAQIGAHRAGAGIAPENTPMAFDICLNNPDFKVHELEFDLHRTKDGKLILLHDKTLDRTTNAVEIYGRKNILPSELTYEEISKLNPGENFVADDGSMPFKGLRGDDIPADLKIPLLEEIIDKIESHGEYLYSIDIKDSGENGMKAADELIELINNKGIADRVMVATFNTDITKYLTKFHPETQRSIGVREGIIFYFAYAFNSKLEKDGLGFKAVQIPANQFVILRPATERFIRYCHKYGIAVQFWTIDDEKEIKRLNDIGADCIITNVPDKMYNLLYKD